MSKYIDADRFRMELEKRLKNVRDYMNGAGMKYKGPKYFRAQGRESAYDALLNTIGSLQQEPPLEICSKCIHHGKDDGYCYNPHGGIKSLINENGVYECTGFYGQEQPEVDLKNYISDRLRELGADLINHKPYSFNRGLNVGKINAYKDILDRLNARKEE